LPAVLEGWDSIRDELRSLLAAPATIASVLRSAGAPATFPEIDPPASVEHAAWALFNGHLIRDRFSLADLAWFAGEWSEEIARGAVEQAAAIAAATTGVGDSGGGATEGIEQATVAR
jgi:glycerol-1-phosphate dehydrogenase [NAD(P)+]